jgi:3',5'-cyclic AMP phosphodiesterase CpdA
VAFSARTLNPGIFGDDKYMRRTLAHLSDLHFGASHFSLPRAEAIVRTLLAAEIDHVVVTGDITDGGRDEDMELFHRTFAPLQARGRLTVVPGNHDRLGDDAGARLMDGRRVDVVERPGLFLVRVDSTGPHNRTSLLAGHGRICQRVLAEMTEALGRAPAGALVALTLHHHPLVLPEESFFERLANAFRLPFAAELSLGHEMLRQALGRCDLVLHGHRHIPSAHILAPGSARPLRVYNAGSTTLRGGMNVFSHAAGALLREPRWLRVDDSSVGFAEVPPYRSTEYRLAS